MLSSTVESTRRPVLFLVHRVPYPPDKGDRIRTYHLLRHLARTRPVHLACLADEPAGDDVVASLRQFAERVAVARLGRGRWVRALACFARGRTLTEGAFFSPELARTVREWARETEYPVVVASSSGLAPYLDLPELRDRPAVIDLIDVDSQKWLDYAGTARGARRLLYAAEGRRLRGVERVLARRCRALTLVTEAEVGLFRSFCCDGSVYAVPNGVDLEYFRPGFRQVASPQPESHDCVFVGALDYFPNVDAAVWFCSEIWPELHRCFPYGNMVLVGRRPVHAIRRLTRIPGVRLEASVPDVRPFLERAAVAVVPLRIARGVQNKVLEGLAMGKAVVASPQALEGLNLVPGTHLLTASAAGEWVDAITQLLQNVPSRQILGEAGRRYVEVCHRWDRCLEPFLSILGLPDDRPNLPSHPDAGRGREVPATVPESGKYLR